MKKTTSDKVPSFVFYLPPVYGHTLDDRIKKHELLDKFQNISSV